MNPLVWSIRFFRIKDLQSKMPTIAQSGFNKCSQMVQIDDDAFKAG